MRKFYKTYPRATSEPLNGAGIARSRRSPRQRLALAKALHAGNIPVRGFTVTQAAFIAGVPVATLRAAFNAEKEGKAAPWKTVKAPTEKHLRKTVARAGVEATWQALVAELDIVKPNSDAALAAKSNGGTAVTGYDFNEA